MRNVSIEIELRIVVSNSAMIYEAGANLWYSAMKFTFELWFLLCFFISTRPIARSIDMFAFIRK